MHAEKDHPARSARPAVQGSRRALDDDHDVALARDRDHYPALYPFGMTLTTYLDAEAERTAPFEARLRSAWRYILLRVKRFALTLKPREAAVLDAEDIVNSVVAKLVEKDYMWDYTRGRYNTFVESVIVSVLATCHEKARAISGPSNSHCRMKEYRQRISDGTMKRHMRWTMDAIERVMGDFSSWDDETLVSAESDEVDVQLIVAALRSMDDPIKTWAFVHHKGLLGQPRLIIREIAERLDLDQSEVKDLLKEAGDLIRAYLVGRKEATAPWEEIG